MSPWTQQCQMGAWVKAEVADDTHGNEPGFNHPVCDRSKEAQRQEQSGKLKTVTIMGTMIAAKIDIIKRLKTIAAAVWKMLGARV